MRHGIWESIELLEVALAKALVFCLVREETSLG